MVRVKLGLKEERVGTNARREFEGQGDVPQPLNHFAARVVVVLVCFWTELSWQNLMEHQFLNGSGGHVSSPPFRALFTRNANDSTKNI